MSMGSSLPRHSRARRFIASSVLSFVLIAAGPLAAVPEAKPEAQPAVTEPKGEGSDLGRALRAISR